MTHGATMRTGLFVLGVTATVALVNSAQADSPEKNIMVFGDSITWGWVPKDPIVPTVRHAEQDRWPEIMAEALGDGYTVVTEGLSGRTTNVDDPDAPGLMNGADYLDSAIMSHEPLDLVIIMLGTNDTKNHLDRSPLEIGLGMGALVNIVQEDAAPPWYAYDVPAVLVVSPPPLGDEIAPEAAERFQDGNVKIEQLPPIYSAIAESAGEYFFDAASVVQKSDVGVDGIHLLVSGNQALGAAVAERVKEIFE